MKVTKESGTIRERKSVWPCSRKSSHDRMYYICNFDRLRRFLSRAISFLTIKYSLNWLWLVRLVFFPVRFFLVLFYYMRYLDRGRREKKRRWDKPLWGLIDQSYGNSKKKSTVPFFFLLFSSFFIDVCVQPYVRKRHWSGS